MSRTFILTFAFVLLTFLVLFGSADAQASSVTDSIGKKLEDGFNSIMSSITGFITKVVTVVANAILAPFRAIATI